MTPEERQQKEAELERLRVTADAAHQAAAEKPGDEALEGAADSAEDAYNAVKAELDAAPPTPTPEEGEEDDEDENIDFDKELKDLEGGKPPTAPKTELEKAERALFFNAKKLRELGGDPAKVLAPKDVTPPEKEPDERYVTKADLAQQEADSLSGGNAAKAKVIMWHYANSIQRTGNYKADIENAYYIAHKGQIRRSIDEIRRAQVRTPQPSGPGRPPRASVKVPQLSPTEQSTMKRRGFKPNADGSWEGKGYVMRFTAGKGWETVKK